MLVLWASREARRPRYFEIAGWYRYGCSRLAPKGESLGQGPEVMRERYTPGHTSNAVDFMSRRTLESHGAFFIPMLTDGMSVLDCGSGPGTITCDIAQRIPNGRVVGVDADESQVALASDTARAKGLRNVEFRKASAYELPSPDESFDAVFSHALLEHLGEPDRAISEFRRVLKPGGSVGLCSPDWGGFLLAPPSAQLSEAIARYEELSIANGGDPYIGRKFAYLLEKAGFEAISMQARYEVYGSQEFIGEYLALQLDSVGESRHVTTLREWADTPNGMFAQAWVSCTGRMAPSTTG